MSSNSDQAERLIEILDMIGNMAALNFSKVLVTSDRHDMIDAIALGLNMLSEELNDQVVHRKHLDEINRKLERFAATTAHDLKSPLNNVTGLTALLKNSLKEGDIETSKLYLTKLEETNRKMIHLVEGILNYSRTYSENIVSYPIDLRVLIEEVIETDNFKTYASISLDESLPEVLLDKTIGIQIFRNLLDNAIKYCDKPKCEISITSKEIDANICEITIEDNGPGIHSDFHTKIFELYGRADNEVKGLSAGIGLATVKKVVESMGSTIRVESEKGKGAKFIFTLKKKAHELQRK